MTKFPFYVIILDIRKKKRLLLLLKGKVDVMICKKCGSECPDGNIFCEVCGAELESPVLPENIDEKGRVKNKKKAEKQKNPKKEKPVKKKKTPEEKTALKKKLKGGAVCLGVIAVIVLIVWLSSIIGANKGYNAALKIPLGRNVEYAAAETKLDFQTLSTNGLINNMADFDYICLSEDTVKVSGSEQPRWVIMLTTDEDDIITHVEYYDFSQLKLNWKGRKEAAMLTEDSLEYGMNIRSVNKTIGMKPYYIRRSVSNDSIYGYRYYYTDEAEGYDHVYNYFVDFSDVENSVRNVHYSEINYAGAILSAWGGTPVENTPPEETSAEEFSEDGSETDENSETDESSEGEEEY